MWNDVRRSHGCLFFTTAQARLAMRLARKVRLNAPLPGS